jgi:hypothetical protein
MPLENRNGSLPGLRRRTRDRPTFKARSNPICPARRSGIGWWRGGAPPRYVRLRPRASLSAILESRGEQALPDKVNPLIAKATVEILTLRPTMSYGLALPPRP